MDDQSLRGYAIAACAALGLLVQGCGGGDAAPGTGTGPAPGPAACPVGNTVAGICAGVPSQAVCDAEVCAEGAGCGSVVTVGTDAELQAALGTAKSGTCIALKPGAYGDAHLPSGVSLLGRSAALVHLKSVSVSAGKGTVIRGLEVTNGGIDVTGGALDVRISASRSSSAVKDGIRIGAGSSVTIDATEILGATHAGVLAVDAVSLDVQTSVVRGTLGPGIWSECTGGCACAAPSSLSVDKSALRENALVGLSLLGVKGTLTGVEITDNDVGKGFQPSGGISASGCSSLTASGVKILDNSAYGILVDGSSATIGQSGTDSAVEVSRNLLGIWVQKSTAAQPVHLDNCTLDGNSGVGIGVGGDTHGMIINGTVVKNTSLITLPLVGGGSNFVGDGLNWLEGSTLAVDGLTLSGNARASVLIDGSVGVGSSIAHVTLSGGDEQKGMILQNFPASGTAPALGSGAPALKQSATETFAIPVAPTAPATP